MPSRHSDGLRAGDSGFNSRQWQDVELYFTTSRPTLGPSKPPDQRVPGSSFSGSPPSAEAKNSGATPPHPPHVSMA